MNKMIISGYVSDKRVERLTPFLLSKGFRGAVVNGRN